MSSTKEIGLGSFCSKRISIQIKAKMKDTKNASDEDAFTCMCWPWCC